MLFSSYDIQSSSTAKLLFKKSKVPEVIAGRKSKCFPTSTFEFVEFIRKCLEQQRLFIHLFLITNIED